MADPYFKSSLLFPPTTKSRPFTTLSSPQPLSPTSSRRVSHPYKKFSKNSSLPLSSSLLPPSSSLTPSSRPPLISFPPPSSPSSSLASSYPPPPSSSSPHRPMKFSFSKVSKDAGFLTMNSKDDRDVVERIVIKNKEIGFLKGKMGEVRDVFNIRGLFELAWKKILDRFFLMPNIEFEITNVLGELGLALYKTLGEAEERREEVKKKKEEERREEDEEEGRRREVGRGKKRRREEEDAREENERVLENLKLKKENENLRKYLQGTTDIEAIMKEFVGFKEVSRQILNEKETSIKSKDEILKKFSYQLNLLKSALIKSEKDNKALTASVSSLQYQNTILTERIETTKTRFHYYYEIALMQKEETDSRLSQNQKLYRSIAKLNSKLAELKKKIGENVEFIGSIPVDKIENDFELKNELCEVIGKEFAKNMIVERDGKFDSEKDQAKFKEMEDLLSSVNLSKYQYIRPPFSHFIENFSRIWTTKERLEKYKKEKISQLFISTLRSILDSKFSEFLLSDDHKNLSRFPDFVYSWLCNYSVSRDSRKVSSLDSGVSWDPEASILEFGWNLYHPMGSKLWEVVNFREFLEERAGSDELFFFLHCRFLINRGEGGDSFGYTQFIRLDYTDVIVEIVFADFEEETKNFIKARLKDKSKIKNKTLLIDVSFVLRVFFEYYRMEKRHKFFLIRDLFRMITLPRKSSFTFPIFKQILAKIFPKLTELEKAEIYRDCWMVGKGEITAEILFTVLNENNIFLQNIKLKSYMTSIKQRECGGFDIPNNIDYLDNMKFIYDGVKNMEGVIRGMMGTVKECGVEKIDSQMENLMRVFSEKQRFVELSEFAGQNPESILIKVLRIVLNMISLKQLNCHFRDSEYTLFSFASNHWDTIKNILVILEGFLNKEQIREFERDKKVRKLQKFFKTKANRWYSVMRGLMKKAKEKENLHQLFAGIEQSCLLNTQDVLNGQEKLTAVLTKILEELELIRKENGLEKDKELNDYLEKIGLFKKRLSTINTKMDKIQSRVEKIEKKYLSYHNIIQNLQDTSLQK